MYNKNLSNYLILLVMAIGACAPARYIQPLEHKQSAVTFNLGGPMFNFSGMTIPAPLSSISYGYGLKENLTVFGSLHTTALLFGNFQSDFGATYKFINQKKFIPNISASGAGNILFNFDEPNFHFWPQVDLNAYWEHGKHKSYFYTGISNWFELAGKRAHQEPSIDHWLFNPQAGYVFNLDKWSFFAEFKLIGLGHNNVPPIVDYRSIAGNKGSTGLYFGLTKKF